MPLPDFRPQPLLISSVACDPLTMVFTLTSLG